MEATVKVHGEHGGSWWKQMALVPVMLEATLSEAESLELSEAI